MTTKEAEAQPVMATKEAEQQENKK